MTAIFFYQNLQGLNKDEHRDYKISSSKNEYSFVKESICVSLAGDEFINASKEFPIIFTKNKKGQFEPAVLLGLRENENLFVDDKGKWRGDYVPAFIRRYPFLPIQHDNEDKVTICIDADYSGFQKKEGEILFSKKGDNSPFLQRAIDFLMGFHQSCKKTKVFVDQLEELDVFKSLDANVSMKDGREFSLSNFYIIDETKLSALPNHKITGLFKSGELAWIYAHLFSIRNLNKLTNYIPKD